MELSFIEIMMRINLFHYDKRQYNLPPDRGYNRPADIPAFSVGHAAEIIPINIFETGNIIGHQVDDSHLFENGGDIGEIETDIMVRPGTARHKGTGIWVMVRPAAGIGISDPEERIDLRYIPFVDD